MNGRAYGFHLEQITGSCKRYIIRSRQAGNDGRELIVATCKFCFLRREIVRIVKLTMHVTIGVAVMVMTSAERLRVRLRTTVSYLVLVDSVV